MMMADKEPRVIVPRVTVLTAVHNGERFLDTTITSILAQSYTDFEYILVDDASTDSSPTILARWAERDPRIRLLHNPRPLNPAGALNRGLSEARGEYVANLDHDDLAYPTRLAEQVAYLDANPHIGVVGSQINGIDESGKEFRLSSLPTIPILARWRIFFHNPVLHSVAMMRRALVEQVGNYSVAIWSATDYELVARLSRVTEISNLATTLAAYRRSTQQITSTHSRIQAGQVLLFLQSYLLTHYGFDKRKLPVIASLYYAVRGKAVANESNLNEAGALLGQLYQAFVTKTILSDEEHKLVTEDCAWYYLQLAWTHRRLFRAASRSLLARSLELDPGLWRRSQTWERLRRLRLSQRKVNAI